MKNKRIGDDLAKEEMTVMANVTTEDAIKGNYLNANLSNLDEVSKITYYSVVRRMTFLILQPETTIILQRSFLAYLLFSSSMRCLINTHITSQNILNIELDKCISQWCILWPTLITEYSYSDFEALFFARWYSSIQYLPAFCQVEKIVYK